MRMRHIILSSVACLAVQYFPTLYHKRHDFRKQFLNIKLCFVFSLQILSDTFLILRRIQRDMITNVFWSSCNVPVVLSDIIKLEGSRQILKKLLKYLIQRKSVLWTRVVPCGRTDGQTGMTKQTTDYRNFANAPKNGRQ